MLIALILFCWLLIGPAFGGVVLGVAWLDDPHSVSWKHDKGCILFILAFGMLCVLLLPFAILRYPFKS